MFGPDQLKYDRFLRTLGLAHVARQELEAMDAGSLATLQAYADGINAYLKDHQGSALSLEYVFLKLLNAAYRPEPWQPEHTLMWNKIIAWYLSSNMNNELRRAVLLRTLAPQQVADLYPPYPPDHPIIAAGPGSKAGVGNRARAWIGDTDQSELVANLPDLPAMLPPLPFTMAGAPGIGSNNWVISGRLTSTGRPLLANDPHLGVEMPSIWYQNALHCLPRGEACPYNVTGFSFAGSPGVVIGHNDRIAWGMTNVGPDVQDLFVEKVNPQHPDSLRCSGNTCWRQPSTTIYRR